MTLEQAQKGEKLMVINIMDPEMKIKAIRFGIMEGAEITCMEKMPSGPVVIQKGKQELAIGLGLARRIVVEPALSILSAGGSLSYGTNRGY